MSIKDHLDKSHNSLDEIQGGTISERYHLSSDQYNITSSLSVNGGELLFNSSTIGITDHSLLSNLNTSTYSHVTSTIASVVASLSVNNNELLFNGATIASVDNLIATKYAPISVTVTAGVLTSGTIDDILTPNTGTYIRVDETSPGGLTVEFEYNNVDEFNSISYRIRYVGGSGHILQQQIWNKDTLTWDLLSEQIGPQSALTWMTNAIGNSDPYINGGIVKTRIEHITPFNSSHYLLIDYVTLISSVGGSVIPIPTQTQAENITDVSGSPFLWPIIRLKQFISKLRPIEILYSKSGDIGIYTGTLGRIIKRPCTITSASIRFGTAGVTGDTTIVVMNGATTIGTVTIASGVTTGELSLSNPSLALNDIITVDCTLASTTNPKDLSITFLATLT